MRDTLGAIRAEFAQVDVTPYRVGRIPLLRMPHIAGWAGDDAARHSEPAVGRVRDASRSAPS